MAAGDVPYREFPLVYPPGTFLIQAGLIRVFGSHYFLHPLYAALVSGRPAAWCSPSSGS